MIPRAPQREWTERVRGRAQEHDWSVFEQTVRNQRQHDPSMILTRLDRIIAVWLRTGRKRQDRQPPVQRYGDTHVECYVWYPEDLPIALLVLTCDPREDDLADLFGGMPG